jgi:hypothetical protein
MRAMSVEASQMLSASLEEVETAKTKNIIEMAFDFTAMMWLFAKGSPPKIHRKLETAFAELGSIREQKDYDLMHADFCGWFTQSIDRAQKKKQRESGAAIRKSSYGQAAKVIDIAAKVYVYYCALPSRETAQVLLPLLHGAVDNQIVKHLIRKFPDAGVKSKQLEDIDRSKYEQLQSLVRREIREDFNSEIVPVQYDDTWFRRLNRTPAS